jgi:hypothetical protein
MNPKEFKNPPRTYAPAPFWSWNGDLDEKELQKQIRDMAPKGLGGYFMHSRVGLITPYLSKKWYSCIRACAEAAKKTRTAAWSTTKINGRRDSPVGPFLKWARNSGQSI